MVVYNFFHSLVCLMPKDWVPVEYLSKNLAGTNQFLGHNGNVLKSQSIDNSESMVVY